MSGKPRVRLVTDYIEMKPLALFFDQMDARISQPHTNEIPPDCRLETDVSKMKPLALFFDHMDRRMTQPHNEIDNDIE